MISKAFLIMLIISIVVIVMIALAVYCVIYTKNINKKIQNGGSSRKKMMDIPKAVMISVIVILLLYSVISTMALYDNNDTTAVNRDNIASINLEDYTYDMYWGTKDNTDASFARMYSKDDNPGYRKTVKEDGDFIFTVFTRITDHDDFHPDFICYVDCIKEDTDEFALSRSFMFQDTVSGKVYHGMSTGGGDTKNDLYIGNINENESVKITMGLTPIDKEAIEQAEDVHKDDGDASSFISDTAVSSGSVTITIE